MLDILVIEVSLHAPLTLTMKWLKALLDVPSSQASAVPGLRLCRDSLSVRRELVYAVCRTILSKGAHCFKRAVHFSGTQNANKAAAKSPSTYRCQVSRKPEDVSGSTCLAAQLCQTSASNAVLLMPRAYAGTMPWHCLALQELKQGSFSSPVLLSKPNTRPAWVGTTAKTTVVCKSFMLHYILRLSIFAELFQQPPSGPMDLLEGLGVVPSGIYASI